MVNEQKLTTGTQSSDRTQLQRVKTVLSGIALALLGVFFLLIETGMVELSDDLRDWWPLVLIVFGLAGGGYFLVALGTWFLIGSLELFGLGYSDSWPVVLIICGIAVTGRALIGRNRHNGCGMEGSRS